jgi:acetolactate synthase small subunit
MRHSLFVQFDDQPQVLVPVTLFLTSRGLKVEQLALQSANAGRTEMNVTVSGDELRIEELTEQLLHIDGVTAVQNLTEENLAHVVTAQINDMFV